MLLADLEFGAEHLRTKENLMDHMNDPWRYEAY